MAHVHLRTDSEDHDRDAQASDERGQTVEDAATVSQVALRFDSLRSEALPRSASKDLIMKVAEDKWT
jgi:hypothetical protein